MVLIHPRPELGGKLLVEGTSDWQIVDSLASLPGERVVAKTRYSGFCRTGLADALRVDGIRNLLFTGIATTICVESTARDAYFEEFWPILVEDAMSHAGPEFCRQATLWSFENVFGWVTNVDAVVHALAATETVGERAAAAPTRRAKPSPSARQRRLILICERGHRGRRAPRRAVACRSKRACRAGTRSKPRRTPPPSSAARSSSALISRASRAPRR